MSVLKFFVPCLIALVVAFPSQGFAGEKGVTGDAEAAKHGFESAMLQVVEEENLTDFIFRQYNLGVLSPTSWGVKVKPSWWTPAVTWTAMSRMPRNWV